MENTENRKLGGGIITVCILLILGYVFSIGSSIFYLFNPSIIQQLNQTVGESIPAITTTTLTIGLIMSIVALIGVILVLCKKAVGVYIYYLMTIISLLYTVIMNGINMITLFSIIGALILPVLLGIFIYKRRYVFGLGNK